MRITTPNPNDSRSVLGTNCLEGIDTLVKKLSGEPLKLSVCIICKNEEDNILRAVDSMGSYANEVVVMDTGSTDRTMANLIKSGFTNYTSTEPSQSLVPNPNKRLYQCEWRDDFAYARNEAQKHCTGDYILWMDADDEVPEESAKLIKASMEKPGPLFKKRQAVLSISMVNMVNDKPVGERVVQPRIYPNNMGINWDGKIHESIVPAMTDGNFTDVIAGNIYIYHWGYNDPETNKKKNARNMEYLKREPETPLTLYHMGTTSICMGDIWMAVQYYRKLLERKVLQENFRDHIRYMLGSCLFDMRQFKDALKHFKDNTKPDAVFYLAECYIAQKDYNNAKEKYVQYLSYGDINDPWGTRQRYYRYLAFSQLIEIYDFEITTIKETFKKEYPTDPWKSVAT